VGVPSAQRDDVTAGDGGGGRMFRLALTDGVTAATAYEVERLPDINAAVPPGTKVAIRDVDVRRGALLLRAGCLHVLGGGAPAAAAPVVVTAARPAGAPAPAPLPAPAAAPAPAPAATGARSAPARPSTTSSAPAAAATLLHRAPHLPNSHAARVVIDDGDDDSDDVGGGGGSVAALATAAAGAGGRRGDVGATVREAAAATIRGVRPLSPSLDASDDGDEGGEGGNSLLRIVEASPSSAVLPLSATSGDTSGSRGGGGGSLPSAAAYSVTDVFANQARLLAGGSPFVVQVGSHLPAMVSTPRDGVHLVTRVAPRVRRAASCR